MTYISSLFIAICSAFGLTWTLNRLLIPEAYRRGWVDIPSGRRIHLRAVPIVGGLTVGGGVLIGVVIFSLLRGDWFLTHRSDLWVWGAAYVSLMVLGLRDDIVGLGPTAKLAVQFSVTLLVLALSPSLQSSLRSFLPYFGQWVWPLGVLWIVGVTNAVNLVDGLDGLAGGTVAAVSVSLALLGLLSGGEQSVALPLAAVLFVSVLSFLRFNWNPAQIFLGDNGSLPLGFLIGVLSLCLVDATAPVNSLLALPVLLAFPIIDMGLCSWRRVTRSFPIFKADRNHIHFRLQRLGLSVRETAVFLITLSLVFQFGGVAIRLVSVFTAPVIFATLSTSLFCVLFLIGTSERGRIREEVEARARDSDSIFSGQVSRERRVIVARVQLDPLFEAVLREERHRADALISAVKLLLRSVLSARDRVHMGDRDIRMMFFSRGTDYQEVGVVLELLKRKLGLFQEIYGVQYSMMALPVRVEVEEVYESCPQLEGTA